MNTEGPGSIRKIIHVDMDAFFAAVEQRNDPSLRGKPVIVGGDPSSRGVVCACSYEARKYGIHSAMASRTALRLCPRAVFLRPNFDEYCRVSDQIMEIFRSCTDLVEPLSIDEAYLDVTDNRLGQPLAARVAKRIKEAVRDVTGLTASAGVSYNKFLAKVASDFRKPDGLTVVTPEKAAEFIARLPIGKFYGIGRVTESRMHELGIRTGADLARIGKQELCRYFGKNGIFYYDIAHGVDDRAVSTTWVVKSIGKEHTLRSDTDDITEMHRLIDSLAMRVCSALEEQRAAGRTLTLKVKYDDFTTLSRGITLDTLISTPQIAAMHARELLRRTEAGAKKVRLLGITFSNLVFQDGDNGAPEDRQLELPF